MNHVVALVLGTGVGGGVIANGQVIRGARGAGGELGHIVVDPKGPLCGCEARGCLEAFSSATALEKRYRCTPLELEERAKDGDTMAVQAFETVGYHLGLAISSLCTIFEPEIVVLAGKISRAAKLFLPSLLEETADRLKNHPAQNVRIEVAKNIDDAGLLGAAYVAFE